MLAQPVARRLAVADVEPGAYFSAFLSMTHAGGIGPVSQQQTQRIQQDRLAGAGFPGKRAHARAEIDLQVINDGKVADLQI